MSIGACWYSVVGEGVPDDDVYSVFACPPAAMIAAKSELFEEFSL
jgi:hypothetical protein